MKWRVNWFNVVLVTWVVGWAEIADRGWEPQWVCLLEEFGFLTFVVVFFVVGIWAQTQRVTP
jgi:hypothetical protein